jgi:hypothetical protein
MPDLVFETPDQLTRFQTAVLDGLLRGQIGSTDARTAVEIAKVIHETAAKSGNEAALAKMAAQLGARLSAPDPEDHTDDE